MHLGTWCSVQDVRLPKCMSCDRAIVVLTIYTSAEGAKNVSWLWLSPLRGWGSLTMTFTGKFVYIKIYIYIYIYIFKYIYLNIYIYIYIYIFIYTNLPVNVIVRLPHPRSGDSHSQETFLAPSADVYMVNTTMALSQLMHLGNRTSWTEHHVPKCMSY